MLRFVKATAFRPCEFYCLSINEAHNYFVSKNNVFVHNEPLTLTLFTIGSFEFTVKVAFPAIIGGCLWLGQKIRGKKFVDDSTILKSAAIGTMANGGLILYKGMTNKEAKQKAKEKGYDKEVKIDNNKNAPVYENDKGKRISPDIDQHGPSVWKEVDRNGKRIASLDENLNPIKK